jgi:hypothetical protein
LYADKLAANLSTDGAKPDNLLPPPWQRLVIAAVLRAALLPDIYPTIYNMFKYFIF